MLRYYQTDAYDAIQKALSFAGNYLVTIPTAGGKSHVIAHIAKDYNHVLILQPTRELLAQNHEKLAQLVPKEDIGIFSASFNSKEIKKFTFATIQSVYKKPELFKHIKLVIIDESHLVPVKSLGTMYREFLDAIQCARVLGFTATPYRLEIGYAKIGDDLVASTMLKLLNRMRHKSEKKCFWSNIVYNIPHQELLDKGYLSPIEYIHEPLLPYKEIPVNKSYSDYNLEAYTQAIVGREAQILSTISEAQKRYKSVLVFCSTTEQAKHLSEVIVGSKVVTGETDEKERVAIIKGFKEGSIKTVFNCNVLTTGFDHPPLDCIIMLRPSRSLVLYNQMVGRGVRLAEGKTKCTVIDFTSTVRAIGPVESFKLYKNEKGLWDLKTSKFETWNNRILFSMIIQK